MKFNSKIFRVAEMFSDSVTGKTSITKVCGAFLILTGSIYFAYCVFFVKELDRVNAILIQSFGVISLGAGLIGIKVFKPAKPIEETTETENQTV